MKTYHLKFVDDQYVLNPIASLKGSINQLEIDEISGARIPTLSSMMIIDDTPISAIHLDNTKLKVRYTVSIPTICSRLYDCFEYESPELYTKVKMHMIDMLNRLLISCDNGGIDSVYPIPNNLIFTIGDDFKYDHIYFLNNMILHVNNKILLIKKDLRKVNIRVNSTGITFNGANDEDVTIYIKDQTWFINNEVLRSEHIEHHTHHNLDIIYTIEALMLFFMEDNSEHKKVLLQ